MRVSYLFSLSWLLAVNTLLFTNLVAATNPSKRQLENRNRTISLGVVLFPGFVPLDVIGPLTPFLTLSSRYPLKLYMISDKVGPVETRFPPHVMVPGMPPMSFPNMLSLEFVATHTPQTVPKLNLLMVPGGMGNMALVQANNTWIEDLIKAKMPELDNILSVCTGSVSLARAGVLKKKKATTNKAQWAWVTSFGEKVKWIATARWTSDGKVWTSSGVAAGIDMAYAFLSYFYGSEHVNTAYNVIEYAPHTDADWDPFSIVHNVPGANTGGSLTSCVRPAGY